MKQDEIDELRHQALPDQGLLIHGQTLAAASGQTFAAISPIDGQTLCQLAEAGVHDVDLAVTSSRRTFESGVWSGMAPQ